jgi:ubiquinone/menaquinone biosynthesis C-methylase UbiE
MKGFLNPNEVLKELNLKEEMNAVDFGSGSGGWVIPLAKILEGGKVYAIDILEGPLSALRVRMNTENIINVQIIRSDVESKNGSTLYNSFCDLVLMSNLLFQCSNKKAVLEEGKRILKPGGRILVVDWKEGAQMGPKQGTVSPDEMKEMAEGMGLKLEKEFEASSFHYGLIFVK